MLSEAYQDMENRMKETIEHFRRDLATVRTGRASASILDNIKASYYGAPTPVNRMATVSTPESNLIVIQPWDITMLGEIEKALQKSDLGLTPSNDGKIIRLTIPPLTEERRLQLVKMINKQAEEYRVALRGIRRETNELVKELESEKEISEDDERRGLAEIQKITDKYVAKIDEVFKAKEKEIMTT